MTDDDRFLCRALELACDNALAGGRPTARWWCARASWWPRR
ncbi:hypothetical protein [Nannocystis pusilla]